MALIPYAGQERSAPRRPIGRPSRGFRKLSCAFEPPLLDWIKAQAELRQITMADFIRATMRRAQAEAAKEANEFERLQRKFREEGMP